jgi:hypothetical protein
VAETHREQFERFRADLNRLLGPAEAGDAKALAELRQLLTPGGLGRLLGTFFTRDVLDCMAASIVGEKASASRCGLVEYAGQLRDEVAGDSPSPVVRLLAEAAAVAWLHYMGLERSRACNEPTTLTLGAYYAKRLTEAQKRYLRALRELDLAKRRL